AYHRHLAAGLAGLPVIVVDYAALTAEPARLVPELLAALGRLGVRGDLDAAAAVTAIEPLLRRATEPAAGGQPPSSALDVELRKQWLGGDLRVVERFAAAQLAPAQAWEKAVLALRRAAHAAEERAVALKDEVGTARAHAAAVDVERAAYGRNMNRLQAQLEEARKSAANSARQVTELEAARTALLRERDRFRQQVGIAGAQSVRADGRSPRGVVRSARRRLLRGLVRVTPPTVLSYAWHNPLFDAAWYREHQRDVNVRKMNPERHFRRHGAREGRNPNEMFQVAWYLAHYPDVAQRRMNPLDHYLLFGAAEGRNPGPAFNTNWYLAQNPDVVRSGLNPLLHYMRYGKAEHRLPKPTQMALPAATVGQPVAIPTAGKSGGNGREAAQPSPAVPMPPLPRVRLAEPTLQVVTTIGDRLFKLIAFYLPQFHPIPENDEWWGKGFTEWTHVKASRPLYEGHPQPRLPTELGFYDLREPEVRERQAALARRYGVSAFCYYYYWFDGRRVLERPLNEVLASGKPDFPFLICWANENWTRRWDGLDQDVLLRQNYSADSSRRFIREVIPILADPRYVRYDGKPVLVIYRVSDIPDIRRTVQIWRDECRESGLGEIHLAGVRFWDTIDVAPFGFDGAVDFPPHHAAIRKVDHQLPGLVEDFGGLAYDYETVVRENLRKNEALSQSLVHRGLMLAWDSTPRRGKTAHFAHGATPELYQKWLSGIIDQDLRNGRGNESLVFINAWNEWGEGANLEPDSHFGSGFLDATKAALDAAAQSSPATSSGARRK
ncbi:MAG: glycoside hydrolase family 99-like domain-containing protein, partial [Chloroflexota bacterium]